MKAAKGGRTAAWTADARLSLLFKVRPRGHRHQDNRNDPKRRIAHSRFLSHAEFLAQDRLSMQEKSNPVG
jgi:hypothetical protein